MKRLAIILLAAALGLGVGAAVGFAREGDGLSSATPAGTPIASRQSSSERVGSRQQEHARDMETAKNQAPSRETSAACDPDAMLPIIREAIDPRSDLGRFWESVDIKECKNGYARVYAVTGGPPPPPGTQLEGSEQVFLQDVGGEWEMLSSGSGLDCYPGSMPPDLKDACEALGLP